MAPQSLLRHWTGSYSTSSKFDVSFKGVYRAEIGTTAFVASAFVDGQIFQLNLQPFRFSCSEKSIYDSKIGTCVMVNTISASVFSYNSE